MCLEQLIEETLELQAPPLRLKPTHFDKTLGTSKIPGAFGWDTTASIVPRSLVPSYQGTSQYLVFTKYNNYVGVGPGGNGHDKIAILDPNRAVEARYVNYTATTKAGLEDVIAANSGRARRWAGLLAPLAAHRNVRHFRQCGMIFAFDVETARSDFPQWCFAEALKSEL